VIRQQAIDSFAATFGTCLKWRQSVQYGGHVRSTTKLPKDEIPTPQALTFHIRLIRTATYANYSNCMHVLDWANQITCTAVVRTY